MDSTSASTVLPTRHVQSPASRPHTLRQTGGSGSSADGRQIDAAAQPPSSKTSTRSKRPSTREKIERLVAEGTSNYPAYLKLIYTGDSEEPSSSEDEFSIGESMRYQRRSGHGTGGDAETAAASGPVAAAVPAAVAAVKDNDSMESDKLSDRGREKAVASTPVADARPGAEAVGSDAEVNDSSSDDRTNSSQLVESGYQSPGPDTDQEDAELRQKLRTVQDDIATLKAVLNAKLSEAAALRQKLGLTAMAEIRHDVKNGLKALKESGTFQKTNAAFKSFSAYASRKMGNLRQSIGFKSVEENDVGSLRTSRSMVSIRSKLTALTTSRSENNVADSANRMDALDDDYEDIYSDERTHT